MSTPRHEESSDKPTSTPRRDQVRETLERRFRHHLRTGQLSPLLHLLMRYKLESLT